MFIALFLTFFIIIFKVPISSTVVGEYWGKYQTVGKIIEYNDDDYRNHRKINLQYTGPIYWSDYLIVDNKQIDGNYQLNNVKSPNLLTINQEGYYIVKTRANWDIIEERYLFGDIRKTLKYNRCAWGYSSSKTKHIKINAEYGVILNLYNTKK